MFDSYIGENRQNRWLFSLAYKNTAQWNLVVEALDLCNEMFNKQVPGKELQIKEQNSLIYMPINVISQWPLFVQWWHTHYS